jgi:sortase (surface protein transpeptidase)
MKKLLMILLLSAGGLVVTNSPILQAKEADRNEDAEMEKLMAELEKEFGSMEESMIEEKEETDKPDHPGW